VTELALAGMSQKLAGLFLEAHPVPEEARCDGPCALRLSQLEGFLSQVKAMDELVKNFPVLDTH
jgi:2-dehydro-3-deoxyphosphooctonate aldolase (KDO 8-P synthase)